MAKPGQAWSLPKGPPSVAEPNMTPVDKLRTVTSIPTSPVTKTKLFPTRADPSNSRNGDTVTLDIISSSLRKITQSKVSLNSLDGVRINAFLDSNSDVANLSTTGEYNMSYDSTNNRFVATKRDGTLLGSALNF